MTNTNNASRLATVRAYVSYDNTLMVDVGTDNLPARAATKEERDASMAAGPEGWIETTISARTLARLQAQAEG
jgi:hypothetical protein